MYASGKDVVCVPISACVCWLFIVGNFRGVQFSRMASLQSFRGLIFADVYDIMLIIRNTLYNCTHFAGLIFTDLLAACPRKL
jgi:hypothetical protein